MWHIRHSVLLPIYSSDAHLMRRQEEQKIDKEGCNVCETVREIPNVITSAHDIFTNYDESRYSE